MSNVYPQVDAVINDHSILPSEIRSRIEKVNLPKSDARWLPILSKLIEADVFRFLDFVSFKIVDVATPSKGFLDLLSQLFEKLGRDLAAGRAINALVEIGKGNPDSALKIGREMLDSGNPVLVRNSGFVLGGLAPSETGLLIQIVKNALPVSADHRLAAARVLYVGIDSLRGNGEAMQLLDTAAKDSDIRIREQAMLAYFQLYRQNFNRAQAMSQITGILSSPESDGLKWTAIWQIHAIVDSAVKFDPGGALRLSELLADTTNYQLIQDLTILLPKLKLPTENCVRIVRKWITSGIYLDASNIGGFLDAIGKEDAKKSLAFMQEWIDKEKDLGLISLVLPDIVFYLLKRDKSNLLSVLESWVKNSTATQSTIALKTFRKLISVTSDTDSQFLDQSLKVLLDLVTLRNVDPAPILKRDTRKRFQCFNLLSEIERPVKKLDYNLVGSNLDNYPNLKSFLNPNWLASMKQNGNTTHPLLLMLGQPAVDMNKVSETQRALTTETKPIERVALLMRLDFLMNATRTLTHLDYSLSRIDPNESGTSDLRDGLQNDEQFWQTTSEIETTAFFREGGVKVTLKPRVGIAKPGETPPTLDQMLVLDNTQILVEIITPAMHSELAQSTEVLWIKNRLRGMLIDEVRKHLKHLQDGSKIPFIVIVDASRSEIDEDTAADALFGSLAALIPKDRETDATWIRQRDSVAEFEGRAALISALIIYKLGFGLDNNPYYRLSYMPNKKAANKLQTSVLERLCSCFPRVVD